jgi:hypothetical protein
MRSIVSFSAALICDGAVALEGGGQAPCLAAESSVGSNMTAPAAITVGCESCTAAVVTGSSTLPAPRAIATALAIVQRRRPESLTMAVFFLISSAGPAGCLALAGDRSFQFHLSPGK